MTLNIISEIEEDESELEKDDQLGSSLDILEKVFSHTSPYSVTKVTVFCSLILLHQLL